MHRTERISSIGQVVPILEAVSQIQDGRHFAFFRDKHDPVWLRNKNIDFFMILAKTRNLEGLWGDLSKVPPELFFLLKSSVCPMATL